MKHNASKLILSLITAGLVSGCEETPNASRDVVLDDQIQTPQFSAPRSSLERDILNNPQLAAARKTTQARAYAIEELEAAGKVQLSVSGTAGIQAGDDTSGTKSALSITPSASKVVDDGGKLQSQIEVAHIAVEQARMDYALQSNFLIEKLLLAYIDQDTATKTIGVIDRNLRAYRARENQINIAAGLGALTNTDLIEIRSTKSKIESKRLEAELAKNAAKTVLSKYLSTSSTAKLGQKFQKNQNQKPQNAPNFQAQSLELGAKSFGAQADAARLRNKPSVQAVISSSIPASDGTGIGVFAGMSLNWTIKDGGASTAMAKRLEAEHEAAELARQSQLQQAELSATNLSLSRRNSREQRQILQQRVQLTRKKIREQETLLQAGRADVASIARELLEGAETEIALLTLDAEQRRQQVMAFSTKGASCDLLDMCDLFKLERLNDH